ncbi:MAG: inositol-3-phosphate synthase [Candidatus Aenigmarchaeota archaeon]|nr:inositol-3-phosphate synthase [Candidatus Aenigmarchaeota archaeon]
MISIKQPEGKLGILLPGMGAVTTTLIAGVEMLKKGLTVPYGSVTQMQTIRLGRRDDKKYPIIKDFVPLAKVDEIEFFTWDITDETAYDAAKNAKVLSEADLDKVKPELEKIRPMKAVFDQKHVKRLSGTHVKTGENKMELAEQIRQDIRRCSEGLSRMVMVWCASTEVHREIKEVHSSLEKFEQGLRENNEDILPSMVYAYAAIQEGVPFVNGSPQLTVDIPALIELAKAKNVPIAGKDLKTGQTMIKTIIAPGIKSRMLGMKGWFSTNILGNRDGEVLDDPESLKSKIVSKASVLDHILQKEMYPQLYKDLHHRVNINYYPPKGDDKEGWDHIDLFGWLGYPMQLKINFLCKDSILAAPIVLDLALFIDLAQRAGMIGIQEWLSFYFKSPMCSEKVYPEHDLFIQHKKLKNTLRHMMGEDLITHLGNEYYREE